MIAQISKYVQAEAGEQIFRQSPDRLERTAEAYVGSG